MISKKATIGYTFLLFLVLAAATQAATFTVTKTADTDDGTCSSDCSLREALFTSRLTPSNDIIEFASPLFDSPKTIILNGNPLVISNFGSTTIRGPGAKLLSISGNNQSRVFNLTRGSDIIINDLTITNGRVNDGLEGGAGIFCDPCDLTLNNVVIERNRTVGSLNAGGGIYVGRGTLNINRSAIINNIANSFAGGGIQRGTGTVSIVNSTISGNRAPRGGGISAGSTLGSLSILNSTIANNTATSRGGGIESRTSYTMLNTIVANNTAPTAPDISGSITSQGHNLIGDTAGTTIVGDTTGNKTDQDPILGTLADNGGATPTHLPLDGSPAIDSADPVTFEMRDQRGNQRPNDGSGNFTPRAEIGAVEIGNKYFVSKTEDTNDGFCNKDCSLREALEKANVSSTDDTIEFREFFDQPRTILLEGKFGALNVGGNLGSLRILGKGARLTSISGGGFTRVIFSRGTVSISDLTIKDGNGGFGGGILQLSGNLTLNRCAITNNRVGNLGGGIYNQTGTLEVINSTISNNRSTGTMPTGGGIHADSNVTITNSTISGNSTPNGSQSGGGLFAANATIAYSTITNNTTQSGAGGIYKNTGGTVQLSNTIVAGNRTTSSVFDVDIGSSNNENFVSNGFNLIGNSGFTGGFINSLNGDQVGSPKFSINPLLSPLANYGGPTDTHAPSINSPAIDKGGIAQDAFNTVTKHSPISQSFMADPNFGNVGGVPRTDQRGTMRPQDIGSIPNAAGGNGSDIGAFEAFAPTAAAVSVSGKILTSSGRAISNSFVSITEPTGQIHTTRVNSFGYFGFAGLEAGQVYVFHARAKGFSFFTQVLRVDENITDLQIIAQ